MKDRYQKLFAIFLKNRIKLQVLALNIICLILFKIICQTQFGSNDDVFLSQVLSGLYGSNGTGYGYINIISGYVLKNLYHYIPMIPWYVILQYISIFISFYIIVYIILCNNSKWGGYISSIVFLTLMGYECYARISYYKTAVVCSVTAFIILYRLIDAKNKKINIIVFVLLFTTGFLWWDKATVMGMFFMLIPCLFKYFKAKNKRLNCYIVITFVIAILLINTLALFNNIYLSKHQNIKEYVSYIKTWQDINQIGWPDYFENQQKFDELAISENTYNLLTSNTMTLGYTVPLEKLQEIKEVAKKSLFSITRFLYFARSYPIHFFDTSLFLGFLIFVFLYSLSEKRRKWSTGIYLFLIVWMIYFFLYMAGTDESSINRTMIWIAAIISLLGLTGKITLNSDELKNFYSVVIITIGLLINNQQYENITQILSSDSLANIEGVIKENPSNIYVLENSNSINNIPFEKLKKGALGNLIIAQNNYLIYNSIKMSIENIENVYFLSEEYANKIVNYLNEMYNANYYTELEDTIYDLPIFMIKNY